MKNTYLILFYVLFLWLVSATADDVNDIIKKVQNTYDDMDNLTATFRQVEAFKLTGSLSETRGKIYVKNGVKYRFESEDQVIVTDGKTVWTFNSLSNQLIIDNVRKNSGALLPRDLLFKYPKKYYATLLKSEQQNKRTVYLIRLDPKEDTHGFFSNIKIWVEKGSWHIRKIQTTDLNGNSTTFEISAMDTKSKLSDDLFKYQAASDAEVIDMRRKE